MLTNIVLLNGKLFVNCPTEQVDQCRNVTEVFLCFSQTLNANGGILH
jgi:hypothetical protein